MASNEPLYYVTEDILLEVGCPKKLTGFDILQDIIMLYIQNPEFRDKSLHSALKELYGEEGEWDESLRSDISNKARYAVTVAFQTQEAWTTRLYPFEKIPQTKDFCLMMADIVLQETKE